MKTKSIIFSGLLLASLGAATTSCEDMLSVEDELHTTNLTPLDTVYQVMGIVNRLQSLVDRTVVLGELRADLVDLDPTVAKTSLQEVMNNNITTENEYNKISDYYAVINACNIYLKYVDSTYVSHNKLHFEKEIQAVKTFRAWTYLELAKVYGQVPFVTDPILTSGNADEIVADNSNRADMNKICTYFINDLVGYASKTIEAPTYGESDINGFAGTEFFIPVRLMLAELYLWRGCFTQSQNDFVEACKHYHDYFCYTGREITPGRDASTWHYSRGQTWEDISDGYTSAFSGHTGETVAVIPMDTCAYDGTWSELYGFFNSQFENNYYVPVIPSKRVHELSQEQVYCQFHNENGTRDTLYSTMKEEWEDSLYMGDLRLASVYVPDQVSNLYTDRFAKERQHIMKYATSTGHVGPDQKITFYRYYRKTIAWLHFAEALNRAGFPQTAFVVLKYGIAPETIQNFVSEDEQNRLSQVATFFRGNLGAWDRDVFISPVISLNGGRQATVLGIHSRGCGDSDYNDQYVLPRDSATWAAYDAAVAENDTIAPKYRAALVGHANYTDSVYVPVDSVDTVNYNNFLAIKAVYDANVATMASTKAAAYAASQDSYVSTVEKMILDEEALEGMFEGLRFYDLMRYAMYHNDPDFIANTVAKRKGADQVDARANALKGGKWYLPLPVK